MLKLETTKTVSSRIIIVIWSSSFWVNLLFFFFSSKLFSSPALNGRASIELGSLSFKKEIFGVQRFKSNWYDSPASFCRGLWCKSGLKICSPHHKFRNEPHTQPLSSSSHFKIMVPEVTSSSTGSSCDPQSCYLDAAAAPFHLFSL